MFKVALTGGIATGKSYVLRQLRERGVPTIDADDIVHEMFGPGTGTTKAIAAQFGSFFLKEDGSIDRALLGNKVFADPESRMVLEAIVHPAVYETIQVWYSTLDRLFGVASIPLLFETRRETDFDFVVVTLCTRNEQIQRIVARDRLTAEQAEQRIAAQMPPEEKARRANFVIRTSGPKLETDRQVEELLIRLGT